MSGIPAGAGSLLNKRLGKYEILALLALGGTAEIYLARIGGAAGFEKYVVVKCLHDHLNDDQDFVKMFLDEARIAAQLDHSNIVQTMELGEHEGHYFMVMEFLAGLSLAMIVRRVGERLPGGCIPVPLALNMLAQSCAGLHYAHERLVNGVNINIVHRDISPQNLVVSFEGVVKVVDFGIAKADQRETKTRSGTIKGKFAYMSPEQCVAQDVDRRTDVFALGVIAHELLTGRRLFKRPSPYETYQAVIDCDVKPPSAVNVELDPTIDALIMKALTKDKESRYPTAEAFGDALLGYLHHRGKGSGPGDVARFFDTHFAQEIDEHGARMRELISGREVGIDAGEKWDEEEEKRRNETVDLGGNRAEDSRSIELHTADMLRPSMSSLSDVITGLGVGNSTGDVPDDDDPADDGDMPADKTRIESNPLALLADMDKSPVSKPAAKADSTPARAIPKIASLATPKQPTPQPMPSVRQSQPLPIKMPPSGPLPLPAPPPGPAASGKFPELANLKTMIADSDDDDLGLDAATVLAPETIKATEDTAEAAAAIGMAPLARPAEPAPRAKPQSATLFDPGSSNQPTQPQPVQPDPTQQPMQPQQFQQPYGQAPMNPSPAPSNGYGQQQIDSGVFVSGPNPQLMSPVGQQYPQAVDWDAQAAAPARALPSWLLACVFIGAIGIALALTIMIAKIVH